MIKALRTVGRYMMLMGRTFSRPERMRMFFRQYLNEIEQLGVNSIGIVLLISFFIGAVITFQYCRNVEIRNAVIDSKDAFWNTEDVTVYDSELTGEYLGWHSRRLRLVNCKISGTQPLCYAHDLVLENCTMADDADLAFEYSTVEATIDSPVHSVKNPRSGHITAQSYGEIILDEHIKAPADCVIATFTNHQTAQ